MRCRVFANNKELVNDVAAYLFEKIENFRTELTTYESDLDSSKRWYGFSTRLNFGALNFINYSIERDQPEEISEDGWVSYDPRWDEILDECGKKLGNNGVAFFQGGKESKWDGRWLEPALYSSPKGVFRKKSGGFTKICVNKFDKSVREELSSIAGYFIDGSGYAIRQTYYPDYADSSYDDMLEKKRERLEEYRSKRETKPIIPTFHKVMKDEKEMVPYNTPDKLVASEDILRELDELYLFSITGRLCDDIFEEYEMLHSID